MISQKPGQRKSNKGRIWSDEDDLLLVKSIRASIDNTTIATLLSRTVHAIAARKKTLRKKGTLASGVLHRPDVSVHTDLHRVFVYGDVHIPYQDPDGLAIMFDALSVYKPDHIIVAGDLIDCEEISTFPKREGVVKLVDELCAGEEHIKKLRLIAPDARISYLEGNHERRFARYVGSRAPALLEVKDVSVDTLLNLSNYGVDFYPSTDRGISIDLGKLLVGHWSRVSKHSAYTAKLLLDDYGKSHIQGHTHRLGAHFRTLADRTLVGYEGGCLCLLKVKYMEFPNWQHGFHTITIAPDGIFQVQQIPIISSNERQCMTAIFGEQIFERKLASVDE